MRTNVPNCSAPGVCGPGPALWSPVLRILFVIDGRIDTSLDPANFGLGYVLATLRDESFTCRGGGAFAIGDDEVDLDRPLNIPGYELQAGGGFAELDRVVLEGVVQSGESLSLDIVTGAAGRDPVATERLRFTDVMGGDPLTWVGPHTPSRRQAWRLWYRIEKADAAIS